jgi:hypothetical protein
VPSWGEINLEPSGHRGRPARSNLKPSDEESDHQTNVKSAPEGTEVAGWGSVIQGRTTGAKTPRQLSRVPGNYLTGLA